MVIIEKTKQAMDNLVKTISKFIATYKKIQTKIRAFKAENAQLNAQIAKLRN
jgi:cell division protein FtsB